MGFIILKNDNLEEIIEDGNYMLAVNNEVKFPRKTSKVINVLNKLDPQFPNCTFIYINEPDNPESVKRLSPGGVEYFPLFYFLKEGEIEDIFFGVGEENLTNILKNYS